MKEFTITYIVRTEGPLCHEGCDFLADTEDTKTVAFYECDLFGPLLKPSGDAFLRCRQCVDKYGAQ